MTSQQPRSTERATQGFVANLAWLRARPSLTLIEVAWRWLFGIPALFLIYREASRALAAAPWRATGVQNSSVNELLTDPVRAATRFADFAAVVGPGLYHAALWLAPVLLIAWAIISGLGRATLLRRMDPALQFRPARLMLLQLLRVVPLAAAFAAWWFGLRALANSTIYRPIAAGGEPQMMLYVGGVIVLSLGLFVLSAAAGWVFSIAPLLSALHGTGALRSVRDALHVGSVRNGLIEINMVLSVVKIALLVLAMVFSACPLPFQSVMTDEFLFWWNVAVAIWYFLASDFFHVARLSGYLRLWQAARR
ncbi:MAG: hypothetical protein ACRYF4_01555 [Janthinobacterium lividum]